MKPNFVDVALWGDGKTRVIANDLDGNEIRIEGSFKSLAVAKYLTAEHARAAEIGHDTLTRLLDPSQQPGQVNHFTLDDGGTTVLKSQTEILGLPLGFGDLDKLESILFQLVPAKE